MSELNLLCIEIDELTKGRNNLEQALNHFRECESITNEQYRNLAYLLEEVNDTLMNKQIELERMKELI